MSVAQIFTPTRFQPRPWLRNGHLQTIAGNLLPRPNTLPPSTPELFEVAPASATHPSSQVLCLCHWQPEAVQADRLTVLLLHGLEGSADSQYILGNANKMWSAGLNVVRMNMRGCGGTESLSPTLYHSGLSGDVAAVVRLLTARRGLRQIAIVGYSLGGNLVLKFAGELGMQSTTPALPSNLRAIVGISPSVDLASTAEALHLPINRFYERRFLSSLRKRFLRKVSLFPDLYDPARSRHLRSLRDFDDNITAFYSGFLGAADYYDRCAAAHVLDRISLPTLIIHALDDPFVRLTPESRTRILANPNIALIEPAHGGHCAFLASPHSEPHDDGYWAESTLLRFLHLHSGSLR